MPEVIDFICVRIQSELEKFSKTGTLPHDLLDGVYTIEDIESCKKHFTKRQVRLANKITKEYDRQTRESLDSLKSALKKEYAALTRQSRTRSGDFTFPHIIKKYRPGINPIRALYYDARDMTRRYNPTSDHHIWLVGLLTDLEFNNSLLNALEADVKRLERIIKRYYWPILKHDTGIPLELFHARQLIKDGRYYAQFFHNLQKWEPEE